MLSERTRAQVMMPIVEIYDARDSGESAQLFAQLIAGLDSIGPALRWVVLELYAVGDLGAGVDLPAFEQSINSLPDGLEVSWQWLQALATQLEQVYDAIFAALPEGEEKPLPRVHEIHRQYPLVLEAIDGTIWRVSGSQDELIRSLSARFEKTLSVAT